MTSWTVISIQLVTDIGFTDIFNIASNVISTTLYDAGIIVYRTPTPTRTQTPINLGNFVWHDSKW